MSLCIYVLLKLKPSFLPYSSCVSLVPVRTGELYYDYCSIIDESRQIVFLGCFLLFQVAVKIMNKAQLGVRRHNNYYFLMTTQA